MYKRQLSSGSLVLNREDGAQVVSIQSRANGQCLFTGNLPFKGVLPTPVALSAGDVFNYAASSPASPLDGITITNVSGDVDIVIGF